MDYNAMTRSELVSEIRYTKKQVAEFDKITGRCFRHHVRFEPSAEFGYNCPACYWEREAGEEQALREKITPKR